MFAASFEYHRAASIKEALGMLAQFGDDARLLSGGHSLIPILKMRLAQPAHLVDITRIGELGQVAETGGRVAIGAAVRHYQVESNPIVRGKIGLLAECAAHIGDVQVRNRGTIGGSLAHSDPAADFPAAVLALEGELKLEGAAGARTVKASDFFVDLMTTAIKPGEILTQVSFAPLPAGAGYAYFKHPQPASGFAIVGVAAWLTLDAKGAAQNVHVGVTGLGAKAFRASAVEKALTGKAPDAKSIADAASHAAEGIDALADIHAGSDFRAELARVYTRRALENAAARAKR
ncbi:MAG TPA: xanthine dehydrogenase family protein subunit M [Candidatus Binataceae bacterium]|nr:xanthine dehydrogenase family protein subunit M [Candidatus Binataceae bacterium]